MLEALGLELPCGGGAERAGLVIDDERLLLVLLQRVAGLEDLLAIQAASAGEVSDGKLLGGTQVDDHRAAIHQP